MQVRWPALLCPPVARPSVPSKDMGVETGEPMETVTLGAAATAPRPPQDASLLVAAAPIGGPLGQALATESERLAAFFRAGGGSTEGLRAPEVAKDILAARDAGATFLGCGVAPDAVSPEEAYDMLLSPHPQLGSVYLGIDGIQMVACQRGTLHSGLDAFAPLAAAHREVLRHGRFDGYAMQCALDRIAGQREPADIQAHSELLVALYDRVKASGRHAGSSEDTAHAMTRLYDWLSPRLGNLSRERVDDVMAWTARGGADEAREAGEHAGTLDDAAYSEFAGVMRAMGSAAAAKQALAVVDSATGGTRAERLAALTSVSAEYAALPRGEDALASFVAVLDAWRGDQPLQAVADRCVALHRALTARGLPDRAPGCFRELETRWRESGDASPGRVYMRFIDHLQRTGSADTSALATSERGGSVERQSDAVVVGGVRVPIRSADIARPRPR